MREIEMCPECGAPVVGYGLDQRCTQCGLTVSEMDLPEGYAEDMDFDEDLDLDEVESEDW